MGARPTGAPPDCEARQRRGSRSRRGQRRLERRPPPRSQPGVSWAHGPPRFLWGRRARRGHPGRGSRPRSLRPPARRRRLRAASAVAAAQVGGGGARRGEAARALPVRPPARPGLARGQPPMRRRCRRGHAAGAAALRVLQRREQSEMAGTVGLGPAEGQCWCPGGRGGRGRCRGGLGLCGPSRAAGGRGALPGAPPRF